MSGFSNTLAATALLFPEYAEGCAGRSKHRGRRPGHTPELRVIGKHAAGRVEHIVLLRRIGLNPQALRPGGSFALFTAPRVALAAEIPYGTAQACRRLFVLELEHDFPRRPDDVGDGHPARATAHALVARGAEPPVLVLHVHESVPGLADHLVGHEGAHRVPGAACRTEAALPAELEGVSSGLLDEINPFFERCQVFQSLFSVIRSRFTVDRLPFTVHREPFITRRRCGGPCTLSR